MHVIFSHHFQFRMHERKINVDHIKLAIRAPDSNRKNQQGRIITQKKYEGKICYYHCVLY